MAPSVAELKATLKALGMSQAGDKGTLEYRIKKGNESVAMNLKSPDGDPVHALKMGKLKKHAARAGISPIGTLDEIMFAYIDYLRKNNSGGNNDNNNDTGSDGVPKGDAVVDGSSSNNKRPNDASRLSEKVLELAEGDDFLGILNLGGTNITASSSVAILRKAYLKLSLVLHPDKNGNLPNATEVFQALVNAYERLTQPELVEDVVEKGKGKTKKKKAAAAISRSNEGCKRTRVCCPRCNNPWSESSVEGNPDYYYNFMMTGLKSFNCATCLFEFGCMTALHYCPFCKHKFEYHPSDFHRKITCGNKKCTKEFGFYMYHCSDRVIKELKIEVKQTREQRAKITEQKKRRAESFRRRRCHGQDEDADEEVLFVIGLSNECPRCGISLADFIDDIDEINHLRNCNDDDGKITANKRRKAALEEKQNKRRKGQEIQDDVAAKAAWDFLGGSNEDMWLLTDGAIQKECAEQGIDTKGKEQHEMIASLVRVRGKKSNALTKYEGDQGNSEKSITESLPTNLHSMTVSQLKAVAASHGIKINARHRKCDIIELLQSEQEGNKNSTLMITDGGVTEKKGKRAGSKKREKCIEILSSSDSESEYSYETD